MFSFHDFDELEPSSYNVYSIVWLSYSGWVDCSASQEAARGLCNFDI